MLYIYKIVQTVLLILLATSAPAASSCFDSIKKLKNEKNTVIAIGGLWRIFEQVPELRKWSVDAIQLDSRINKIFFALDHLCETQEGIPLNDLATYISRSVTKMGKSNFKNELMLLGKTPQEIDSWFQFFHYSKNHKSRTLNISKIKNAIDQATPLIKRYIKLAEYISQVDSSKVSQKKTKVLNIDIDKLLTKQPYFVQALEEISHFPYWDINESTGGS